MQIFIDAKVPAEVKQSLSRTGEVVNFRTTGITYEAISGHPDIFFCQTPSGLVVAPNLPGEYIKILGVNNIDCVFGETPVGNIYPATAPYNAVVTRKYLIHSLIVTDPNISALAAGLTEIGVSQGYTRCNLLVLGEQKFVCSDKGIHKTLIRNGLDFFYVDPSLVLLPGFRNGFFGGCCGIYGNTLYTMGSLDYLQEKKDLRRFIGSAGYEVVELYPGPLFDGGGIFFFGPGR